MARSPRGASPLLLFDAAADGHHPEYVRHLVRGLAARQWPGEVVLAVPEAMLAAHPDLTSGGARTVLLPALPPPSNPWSASQVQWALLNDAVETVRPARILLLYADALVPTLARHVRLPGHPALTTLHFRPPVREPDARLRERVRDVVKRHQLRAVLRHPDLHSAFTLDPRALPFFRAHVRRAETMAVPDPVAQPHLAPDEQDAMGRRLRQDMGVGSDRHLMVLFGSLEPRKGIFQTVKALEHLPAEAAERLAVVLAGPVYKGCRETFADAVTATRQATTAHLELQDRLLDEADMAGLLIAADTVLIPYQRHMGSSGVMIRAAGLGRPTLAQETGLIGEWTRAHRLGRTVDSTDPRALARSMEAALDDPLGAFDPDAARAFAARHTPDAFVRTLLDGQAGVLA